MNTKIIITILFIFPFSLILHSQDVDTLVDVGTHKMHFNIWKGTGTPILFESGGGNDASIWAALVEQIHLITDAPIITYDRVGYGQSEFDPNLADEKRALITHGVDALEKGLKKLGFDHQLIPVGHSYGGYYATYLAANNPSKVKGIVLIDAVLSCYHTQEFQRIQKAERTVAWLNNIKSQSKPLYYECLSNQETIEIMKHHSIPAHIPLIDLVADNPPSEDAVESERWKSCHQELVKNNPNRTGVVAANCGHYLHFDNPKIAVDAIVRLFSELSTGSAQAGILNRYLTYSIDYTNNYRQREYQYWHSERDLNSWGYTLMNENNIQAALKLFELNTILFPEAFNVWDSYGEILLLLGKKEKAKEMYQKSLALNPENESAIAALKKIGE